jgi:hypothetical protein
MFERYTEKARRTIFFARYEASNFGSPYIETEHLLLGLLREDKSLTNRFLHSYSSVESIRRQIEEHTTSREKIPTSVDLPLSNESKHVLAYAAEEAERLAHNFIGTEHLLLGILREKGCFAAGLLRQFGVEADAIRKDVQDNLRAAHPGAGAGHGTFGYFQFVLRVTDLEASINFYSKLGFTPVRGPHFALMTSGSCHLRLEQNPSAEHILSFPGADMNASVRLLESAGIPFERETGPDGRLQTTLRDPDGNTISLQFR